MKTVFIGSVLLSAVALEAILEMGVSIDLVCSLDETAAKNVSDYAPLYEIAQREGIDYIKFTKVSELIDPIEKIEPDFLFVIGVSQILPQKLLKAARVCPIGFHPTALPKYRGRAPIPWMILLGEKNPSISLFRLDEGMDSGDILHQESYEIRDSDYASDAYSSVCEALKRGLRKVIPSLYAGLASFRPQNHNEATYLLIRRPDDGRIDWRDDGKAIHTLIRAAAPPYPGAFAYYKKEKVIITRAELYKNERYIGQNGQIAMIDQAGVHVVTAGGWMLVVHKCNPEVQFVIGTKFS